MFRWYVINTYSGHENKVKANLEHRVKSMNQEMTVRRVVVPTESVVETKDGQKVQTERRLWPGLRAGQHGPDRRRLDAGQEHPRRDRVRRRAEQAGAAVASPRSTACCTPRRPRPAPKQKAEFSLGESVKVISGPLSDFDGEIAEINEDQGKLKVLVSIFERQVPVELEFDKVKKI